MGVGDVGDYCHDDCNSCRSHDLPGDAPMIIHCPICGKEDGVTHGDQLWKDTVCEDCKKWLEEQEKSNAA
jgi:hypothetical protein